MRRHAGLDAPPNRCEQSPTSIHQSVGRVRLDSSIVNIFCSRQKNRIPLKCATEQRSTAIQRHQNPSNRIRSIRCSVTPSKPAEYSGVTVKFRWMIRPVSGGSGKVLFEKHIQPLQAYGCNPSLHESRFRCRLLSPARRVQSHSRMAWLSQAQTRSRPGNVPATRWGCPTGRYYSPLVADLLWFLQIRPVPSFRSPRGASNSILNCLS